MQPSEQTLSPERLLSIVEMHHLLLEAPELRTQTVIDAVVERAAELTGAGGAVVELAEGEEMVYRAACGSAALSLGLRLGRKGSLSGLCVALGHSLRCDDADRDPRVDRAACARVGVVSMICAPLRHGTVTVGVIKVLSGQRAFFPPDTEALLELLARTIGSTLGHASAFESKERESLLDALTGLPNRRAYDADLAKETERARRYRHPLSLVLFDLDGFKAANDTLGHPAGDRVLREVAQILRQQIRATDLCFRLGGDEFALLCPDTSRESSQALAARCSAAVLGAALGDGLIAMSAGSEELDSSGSAVLHARADAALYSAKRRDGDPRQRRAAA